MGRIVLKNVTKWEKDNEILIDSIELEMEENNRILIRGKRGCGKGVLFQLISGNVQPDEGEVQIEGGIALAYRKFPHFKGLDVKDYIRCVLNITGRKKLANQELDRIMKEYGVFEIRDRQVHTLRRQQCLKLMIILAVIQQKEILILEDYLEPADAQEKASFFEFLKHSIADKNILLVCFSDYRISYPFFNKEYEMKNGKIKEMKAE